MKKVLLLVPAALILLLLQSYFWVPGYRQQSRGNPGRLGTFITASIGDATLLNPILSSDATSSQIERLVFEGLIDLDEDLRYRPRLAERWEILEEAFFHVNERAVIPGCERCTGEELAAFIRAAVDRAAPNSPGHDAFRHIQKVEVLPAGTFVATAQGASRSTEDVRFRVHAPERIKLSLGTVVPDLFTELEHLLGPGYFASFHPEEYVRPEQPMEEGELSIAARRVLPATEHNPVIVFHLRPDVRFHDGHLLDANDVKFTYDALLDPRNLSPRIADFEPVKTVKALDPLTVRVVYKRLYSPALGTWGMGILPEHRLGTEALRAEALQTGKAPETFSIRDSGFNRRPFGCGPYIFQEWKSDQYIALERFDDYWEGAPGYERFTLRIIPDRLVQEMEFYAGTLDSYGDLPWVSPLGVPPYQVARFSRDPRWQVFSGTAFGFTYIGYNLRRPPFDDARVRRALGMALDLDKLITYVLHGQGERITGPFLKQSGYYNHGIQPLPYDPEAALALLRTAGWERGSDGWLRKDGQRLQFTLIANSGNDIRKAVLAIAQNAWRKIGVDVRTDLVEWSVFIQERVEKADFDALVLGWVLSVDPDLFPIWHSSQTGPHQLNFGGYQDADADELIVRIREEYDRTRQEEDCHRLHAIIARDQPYTFLYARKWTAVLDRRVVVGETDGSGDHHRIEQAASGVFGYDFDRWVKRPEAATLTP